MTEPRTLSIDEFRTHVTEIVREIEESKVPVVITRQGIPVVEVRPISALGTSLRGSVAFAPDDDLLEPAVEPDDWESV